MLKGYHIDSFDKIVDTAVKAHSQLPMFDIMGWDMTIDEQGNVVIIEFNPDPDMRIEQVIFKDTLFGEYQEKIVSRVYKQG